MTPSNELHELIHRLSKSEKIWIAQRLEDGSDYQILYYAIYRQKHYDEVAIKRLFAKHPIASRFAVIKNQLFHFILKCLSEKHLTNSLEKNLAEQLHYVELLMLKKLHKQASKYAERIKKESVKYELFSYAIEAIGWQKRFLINKMTHDADRAYQALLLEEKFLLRQQDNLIAYQNIELDSMKESIKVVQPRTPSEIDRYRLIQKHFLLQKEKNALSNKARIIFYTMNAICAYQLNQQKKAIAFDFKAANLFEKFPCYSLDQLSRYARILGSIGIYYRNNNEFDQAMQIVKRIKELETTYAHLLFDTNNVLLFKNWAILETDLYYQFGRFDEGVKSLAFIEKLYQKYMPYMNMKAQLILNYNIAQIHFGAGMMKKALKSINTIILNYKDEVGGDIICFAHIFKLIIHIDMGNTSLIKSISQSTLTYLEKRQRLFRTEELFLQLSKNFVLNEYKSNLYFFKKMKNKFEQISKLDSEKNILELFNFSAWIDSHITRKPYAEVYKAMRAKLEK